MPATRLPALMFYPGDWLKDPAVRSVSLSARGLWIDMLCMMHECPDRGYLSIVQGKPMTQIQIARMCGVELSDLETALQELIDANVCSLNEDGCVYSRRMARDEADRKKLSDAGRKGGRQRVANERESKRGSARKAYNELKRDPHISKVWDNIPVRMQSNICRAHVSINDALIRLTQQLGNIDGATDFLVARVRDYYMDSEQGTGAYARGVERWMDEDGFNEDPQAWAAKNSAGKF